MMTSDVEVMAESQRPSVNSTVWRPPPVPKLTPSAELAILARALHREGYDDHTNGHITRRLSDDTFLTLPFQFGWDEVCASDIIRIDGNGVVVEGDWDVTPAIHLHLELHHARQDCGVVVHNHPRFATVWAATTKVPPAYDQIAALVYADEIAVYDEFLGDVTSQAIARRNVEAIGDKNFALLVNHGVLVVGQDAPRAYGRAMVLEWRCKQAWHVEAIGGGKPMPAEGQQALMALSRSNNERIPMLWEWAVRREVRHDPKVLL